MEKPKGRYSIYDAYEGKFLKTDIPTRKLAEKEARIIRKTSISDLYLEGFTNIHVYRDGKPIMLTKSQKRKLKLSR